MDIVEDKYYEKFFQKLRLQQDIIVIFLWAIIIYPILVAINSFSQKPLWKGIFHWDLETGRAFTKKVFLVLLIGGIILIILSTISLIHNNWRENKILSQKRMYDTKRLAARKEILEKIYEERYGEREVRESSQYYIVAPEQNLPNHLIENTFKERNC
ncbi:hypothetical protein ACFO26_03140 [Lactococcus nasutitermitis]|uniref:ABC transporter permease n=2 Tax=Lactococcus nasutitermitis TaxID=1652957 RepID=A0ABV9JC76_9LACT|nr:hypothetical protein [Lactococcus nasutitermitis]